MNAKGEQTLVGRFVIVAVAVLIATVFAISGAFGRLRENVSRLLSVCGRTRSPARRCAIRAGRRLGAWMKLRIDPQDPARIEVMFSVQSDLPVKSTATRKS